MILKTLNRHFALALFLIVFVSRLPTLGTSLVSPNEADFAVQTAVWMDGGIPYVDFVEKKPLLIHAWFRGIFEIFGLYNMTAVHVMNIGVVLLTIAGLYVFVRYVSGEKAARWAALIYAFFQSFYDFNDFLSTTTEIFMNLFAVFAAYAFFKSMREDRPGVSLMAGSLMGLSILAKPVGVAIVPACIITLAWYWYAQRTHRWTRYLEELFLLAVGILFPVAIMTVYLTDVGGFDGFVTWVWFGNLRYAQTGVDGAVMALKGLSQTTKFLVVTWALWSAAVWVVVRVARQRRWRVEIVFLASWLMCSMPMVALGGRFFMHYYLQFLPPLIALAAIGVVSCWEPLLTGRTVSVRMRKRLRVGSVVLVLVVPYFAAFGYHVYEIGAYARKNEPARDIAAHVASITAPDDRLFVWGHNADIYFYSRRMPASRFVYCSYLSGIPEGYEHVDRAWHAETDLNAWVMLRDDLVETPPAVIVDLAPTNWRGYGAHPIGEQLFLANFVRDHYEKRTSIHGADIYVKK